MSSHKHRIEARIAEGYGFDPVQKSIHDLKQALEAANAQMVAMAREASAEAREAAEAREEEDFSRWQSEQFVETVEALQKPFDFGDMGMDKWLEARLSDSGEEVEDPKTEEVVKGEARDKQKPNNNFLIFMALFGWVVLVTILGVLFI